MPESPLPSRLHIVNGRNIFEELLSELEDQLSGEDAALARLKMVLLITGRTFEEFGVEDPKDLSMSCFGASPSIAHYEEYLSPILSDAEIERAKTFIREGIYARSSPNRHDYGNAFKSFYMLTGGIPPGEDFREHCRENGKRRYGDPKKGFPLLTAANRCDSSCSEIRSVAVYILENIKREEAALGIQRSTINP